MSMNIRGPVTTETPGGGVLPKEFNVKSKLATTTPPMTRSMKNVNR
jgi:hypothetical protein